MKKIIDSLKYIKVKDIIAFIIFVFMIIPSFFFRIVNIIRKRKIFLIMEDGKSARDNGYHFFKYMRKEHSNCYCFYVIDKKSNDYNKVKEFGNIIQYKSLKHWLYYLSSYRNISNQKNGNPNATVFYVIHVLLGLYKNRVFLQHGITKDDSPWLYFKNTKFKYFICGAKREYDYIKANFGYPKQNLIYTGFARFDNLYDNDVNKKQVLIMPTWRNWLGRETNSLGEKFLFEESDYYKNWNDLINDNFFIDYIEKNNIKVLFYPHINMAKYLDKFKVKSSNIEILSSKYDIQKALKESAIMITDYSSVYMDFAYMIKPVLYYQFDYKKYREKQLQQGYFDYERDGFGPVELNKNSLIKKFIEIYEKGLEKKYIKRMNDFFEIRDRNNCKRIYENIK